jgi:chemotaxis response regulator CheB
MRHGYGPEGGSLAMGKDFLVVCVGGSAGGLDAYVNIISNLPPDLGIAIVIVHHMAHTLTNLHKILPRYTEMPVELITEGLCIQPNHVFIIPSKHDLHVLDGEFRLKPISKPNGWSDVITVFLHSLAQDWGGKLVAVIVSGLDGDGAPSLRDIKEVGGITIAQMPKTAEWSDMPESAIKTGFIDFVLSSEGIAQKIAQIARAFPGTTL